MSKTKTSECMAMGHGNGYALMEMCKGVDINFSIKCYGISISKLES